MSNIKENIRSVRAHIPAHVTLVCVSKYQPVEALREAYEAGERQFGESRVQELKLKLPLLPSDIQWHFIGHLQTNKVRDLLRLFYAEGQTPRSLLIQSVDSEHLLKTINDEAAKSGVVQDVLLEVHVAKEESKSGFLPEELSHVASSLDSYPHVRVCGLMTMATNTDDEQEIRRCFNTARALLLSLSDSGLWTLSEAVLSMGMSEDFPIAIECGATMIRIGTSIFGERQ